MNFVILRLISQCSVFISSRCRIFVLDLAWSKRAETGINEYTIFVTYIAESRNMNANACMTMVANSQIQYRRQQSSFMSYVYMIRKGRICCTKASLLQRGHSGFSRVQSPIHSQQNIWPHCVAEGSLSSSRHSVHLRC